MNSSTLLEDRWGLVCTVKVGGIRRDVRFPPDTPLKTIRARRAARQAGGRFRGAGAHDAGVSPERSAGVRTPLVDPFELDYHRSS